MGQVWGPKDRPDNDNDKVDKKEQTDLESVSVTNHADCCMCMPKINYCLFAAM